MITVADPYLPELDAKNDTSRFTNLDVSAIAKTGAFDKHEGQSNEL